LTNCARSRGSITDTISQHYMTKILIVATWCVPDAFRRGHVKAISSNICDLKIYLSRFIVCLHIANITCVELFHFHSSRRIGFLLMENKLSVRDIIIALSVVDARSRDCAQQIEWYRYWRWRAYRKLARVSVDLLVLRSRRSPHRPLANQLYRPGLRSSPYWHKR